MIRLTSHFFDMLFEFDLYHLNDNYNFIFFHKQGSRSRFTKSTST
jgi:hypothetical protein